MKRPRDGSGQPSREGLAGVEYFVLDEADRMLDMGFLPQVNEILGLMNSGRAADAPRRQSLMFSATWPPAVHSFAKDILDECPVRISVDQADNDDLISNGSITQVVEIHRETAKEARLLKLLADEGSGGKVLIFSNTKKGCADLANRLRQAGIKDCGELHGNLPQSERAAAFSDFARGAVRHLVATDVAARGLDVEDISLVVCFDFPDSMTGGLEDYVHRIGRTGRAGRSGRAFAFFPHPHDVSGTRSAGNAHELIKLLKASGQSVPSELLALDKGPVTSSVAMRSGKGGKAGKGGKFGKGGKGKVADPPSRCGEELAAALAAGRPAKRFRAEGGVVIEGLSQDEAPAPIDSFKSLPLGRELRRELAASGFKTPMPVQAHAWPLILAGRDCIAVAKTGSGKTLAFLLPALHTARQWLKRWGSGGGAERAGPLALVVVPTRELAAQIHRESERFAEAAGCRAGCVYGGAAWEPQAAVLEAGVELLVATPGRLCFLMGRGGEAGASLVRTIAASGARKQLAEATSAFQEFVSGGGVPTRRVYSALMNAHVMCGDLVGASKIAHRMRDSGFPLGVVEYTTLLKGELAAGNLAASKKVLDDMLQETPAVFPDLRTANTFLRGCLKLGDLQEADAFRARLPEWEVVPDATTFKVIMHLYAQGLRLPEMESLLKELDGNESILASLDNAVDLNNRIAQVACLLGKWKTCKRALRRAGDALARGPAPEAQFDKVRRQELQREVEALRACADAREAPDLLGCLQRTFAFPASRGADRQTAAQVYDAMQRGFGLTQCFLHGLGAEEELRVRVRRCLRGGALRWKRVFGRGGLPTRLEVCSGTGDWAVAQALAEVDSANWAACELRYDRVWSTLVKCALAGVENLALLAGDAGSIMKVCVPSSSLSHVCINFPEPPQTSRNSSCDAAESRLHLLTAEFFEDACEALSGGGVLTIFSDNLEYMRSLARTLGSLRGHVASRRLFEPLADVPAEHLEEAEECCGVMICTGSPGPEAGHAALASSQFDRFFQHGRHTERYYIAVSKV